MKFTFLRWLQKTSWTPKIGVIEKPLNQKASDHGGGEDRRVYDGQLHSQDNHRGPQQRGPFHL